MLCTTHDVFWEGMMLIELLDVEQKIMDAETRDVARSSLMAVIPEQCQHCIRRPCSGIWANDDNSCWYQLALENL